MNAPIVVAQANTAGSTTGTGTVRNIKVTKPSDDHAVTIQLGYDQAYKLDLSAISNEKITLVHIGEKLIILFENKSTVTVEPFFDSMNAPLSNVTVEANGRDFTGSEFASSFPITTDQSVLTAAGVSAAGTPSSGADFHGPSVDPLSEPNPLPLLGQEELPNWVTAPIIGPAASAATSVVVPPPGADAGLFSVNEKGLPGQGEGSSGKVGSGEIADGNAFNNSDPSEATSGALSFTNFDGTTHISQVNGTPVLADGTVIVTTHGILTINLDGTFTYTLTHNDLNHHTQGTGSDGEADVFTYTVEDSSGHTQTATLTIDILDDVPTARPDTDTIAAGASTASGNVITGNGTNEGFNGAGHDTQGADGASITGVAAGTNTTPLTHSEGLGGVAGQFGTLNLHADGSYDYSRTPGTGGGGSDTFTYTLTDGDGDTSVTTLTINIGDSAPTLHVPSLQEPGTQVSEAGLPARGGEPAGSAFGSNSEITSGTIGFNSLDGVSSVQIDGIAVTPGSLPQTISTDATGTLVVTGYSFDATTGVGSINYTYTLTDNTLTDPSSVSFGVTVTDADGDAANNTLTITIVDDAPLAVNDTDTLSNLTHTATGNVITAADTTSAGADTLGADGAHVSSILSNNPGGSGLTGVGAGGATINGQFGTLTIAEDGTYTYARTTTGSLTAVETFTYSLQDGDGDTSSATLTININDSNVTITNLTPAAQGGDVTVNEDDLLASRGVGESAGSDATKESTTQTGTFNISAPDGLDSLSVGGHTIISGGSFSAQSFTTGLGNTLTFTSFSGGLVTYTYTLNDNETHTAGNGTNSLFEDFAVVLKDIDGSTANDTLSVNIIDDVPTAVADTDSVAANKFTAETGNVITAVGTTNAGADTLGADGAAVSGVAAGNTNINLDSAGTINAPIHGTYGTLTLQANGSYGYVRDTGTPGGVSDTFTYTLKDGDGDLSHTTLTISIGDSTPIDTIPAAGGATTTVFESGLPARGLEPAGSNSAANTETTTGTISFTSQDGVSVVSLGGHTLTGSAQTFIDATGSLTASYTFNAVAGTGTINYTYTLIDNTLVDPSSASFAVVVTDADGDTAPAGNLVISIIDDVPTAHADTDSVAANKFTAETGNVITAAGTTNAGADTLGADGALVSGIVAGNTNANSASGVGSVIQGTYGKLTMAADGSYSYVRDAGTAGGVTDTFTYTLKDGDGDQSHTTLTISIGDSTPTDTIPAAGGATTTVFEAGLPARGGEPAGSNSAANSETTSGSINFTSVDGLSTVSLGGHTLTGSAQTFNNATGSLTASYTYNAATGAGVISYSYTLLDNTLVDPSSVSFAVVVTDADGDSAPAGNLVINIIDDVPTAVADTDSIAAGGTSAAGNVITAVGTTNSGADVQGADGAVVSGVAAGNTNANSATGVNAGIHGTYGTLTLQANGSYGYVRDAGTPGGVSDTFTYTLKDGDGDQSHTTLTISIGDSTPTDAIPAAGGATTTVFEKGLGPHNGLPAGSGEMADGNPNNNSDTSETTTGTISFTSPDGLSAVSLGGHTLTTSAQTFTDATGSLTASYTYNAATGAGTINYSYTLLTNTSGDNTSVSFGVTVTDLDGDNAPAGNLKINIVDDTPSANAVTKSLVPAGHDTNLMLVLDVSGSMDDASGVTGLSRLDVMKAAVNELFEQYGDLGNVKVQIVEFSTSASQVGTDWMTIAQAKAAIDALTAGGNTNYDAGVTTAQSIFTHTGALTTAGVQNVSYFMSDGEPNLPNNSVGISATEENTWTTFLNAQHIDSFALGMGTGVTQSALDPVAYNGQTGTNTNSVVVTDLSQLTTTLVGTVSSTGGNILTDGTLPGSFGADGGHIQSITVNGTTYTYNPAAGGSISVSGGADHGSFDTATNTETVTLASGGVVTMIMDNGTYTYTAPANVTSGFTDSIPFVLVDNDGDTAGNSLTVVVSSQDHHPIVRDDTVITNISGSGASIVIPDFALLYNDSDPESQAISITGISNISSATSVTHSSGNVTFVDNNSTGGSFSYTGSTTSPAASDTGDVTIDRVTGNTLTGTGLGEILLGSSGADTLIGNGGSDVMIGGAGADHFRYVATTDGGTIANQAGADHILDFSTAQGDVIEVSKAAFSSLPSAGSNATGIFSSSANDTFGSASERFHFNTATHTLLYDSNGSAAGGTQVALAVLENGGTVDAAHILMVA